MVSPIRPREGSREGLRRLDPRRDFAPIAALIEVAFAEELSPGGELVMRDLRLYHQLRYLWWLLSRLMPATMDMLGGFVWEAEGRIVGNATVTRADSAASQWIISNVAVLPEFRRRGIARALVEAGLQHARQRGGARVLLQVRSDNAGAKQLYSQLGFRHLETVTEAFSERLTPPRLPEAAGVWISAPDGARWHESYDVARAAIPQAVQHIRPLRAQQYRLRERSLFEMGRELFVGPGRERWWAEVEGRVAGLMTIDRQHSPGTVLVEFLVHPRARGLVEAPLLNQLGRRLRGQRNVRLSFAAELSELRALLPEANIRELRTLDQMACELYDEPATR